jgi:hypothetical protein
LINYFESLSDCRYTILYNEAGSCTSDEKENGLLVNALSDPSEFKIPQCSEVECSDHEKEDIRKFCLTQRNSIECQGEFKMVIGTAWTLKSIRQVAKSYGEVIYLDATEGTNDEERPLLTVSTCTGMCKVVTILCAVLPNNQRWVYRWLF